MRGLYFDCFSGISGDMVLGALVDLGVEPAHLRSRLRKLRVGGYTLSASRVSRSGLAGTKVDVMKIDVEGYEDFVLRGAQTLLSDDSRAPSVVFIEVHPEAWPAFGVSGPLGDPALRVIGRFRVRSHRRVS